MRTGMIFKKIGMTHIYAEDGRQQPVTVLKNENCVVLGLRQKEKDGYSAVQIGAGVAKLKNIAKPQRVFYEKSGAVPKQMVAEFRLNADWPEENMADIGKSLSVSHFVVGQYVDATAISIGKGFAGAMKRHNFSGLRATHGVSVSHRSLGSTGQCQDPGKVFKGKKMAGHMGAKRTTIQNLEVIQIDGVHDVVFVKGAVPGARGGWVRLHDAVKRPLPEGAPQPAGFVESEAKKTAKKTAEEKPDQEEKEVKAKEAEEVKAETKEGAKPKAKEGAKK